jgi:acetyl esterase/lipase
VALAESAGAAVLLAALQQARDRGLRMPSGVVLLSPWVDLSLQSWSVTAASLMGTTPYTMESLALVARFYLDGRSATDPIASPLFGSFDGFPPMLIHASRGDILYDDALRLADKARDAGGDLTVRLWKDETHVWERMQTAKARQSIQLAADFIRRRLDAAETA